MTISVLIATYGRREYLEGCVKSLFEQSRLPDEIILVTREGDGDTEEYAERLPATAPPGMAILHARVTEPGVLVANRAGLPLATGDILCFIDDDAAARTCWLASIERLFSEHADVGAIGGRDLQHTVNGIVDEPAGVVGCIRWYGRILGNHHRRWPGVHEVDSLKGCNMAYRRPLVRGFDEGILGHAHYYEMDLCFAVRHAGYKVLFDGDLVVDHYVNAPRFLPGSKPADSGKRLDPDWFFFMHHNRVYVMMKNLPASRRLVFLAYTFASDALSVLRQRMRGGDSGRPEVAGAIFRGKIEGLKRYRASKRAAARVTAS
jgi:glycosyltransferase involved in cell wall biosynthesis